MRQVWAILPRHANARMSFEASRLRRDSGLSCLHKTKFRAMTRTTFQPRAHMIGTGSSSVSLTMTDTDLSALDDERKEGRACAAQSAELREISVWR